MDSILLDAALDGYMWLEDNFSSDISLHHSKNKTKSFIINLDLSENIYFVKFNNKKNMKK